MLLYNLYVAYIGYHKINNNNNNKKKKKKN